MTLIKTTLSAVAIAGGLSAAILGLGASVALADPPPPDPPESGAEWGQPCSAGSGTPAGGA